MSTPSTSKAILQKSQTETIITRNKSAQMRHNLRDKEKTMRNITRYTQLLRSPKSQRNKETNTKAQNKTLKSPKAKLKQKAPEKRLRLKKVKIIGPVLKEKKKQVSILKESKEYYPQKLKRRVQEKKVFLRPKQEMQMIGKTNKRKYGIPRKDISKFVPHMLLKPDFLEDNLRSDENSLLSVDEIIRITENQDLTDEDLMEILTCPSPVWWEDPPNENYMEDAIGKVEINAKSLLRQLLSKPTPDNTIIQETEQTETENSIDTTSERDGMITELAINKCDDKFLKKRSKLENVLGNIKSKGARNIAQISDKAGCDHKPAAIIDGLNLNVDKCRAQDLEEASAKSPNTKKKDIKSKSGEYDYFDVGLGDDDILKDLENMEIPVEEYIIINDDDPNNDKSFNSGNSHNPPQCSNTKKEENVINKDADNKILEQLTTDCVSMVNKTVIEKDSTTEIPTDIQTLQTFPVSITEEITRTSSNISETYSSNASNIEDVSIYDTNVCYLLDDENGCEKKVGNSKNDLEIYAYADKADNADTANKEIQFFRNEDEIKLLETPKPVEKDSNCAEFSQEYVTVYKIISTEAEVQNIASNNEDINSKIINNNDSIKNTFNNGIEKSNDTENGVMNGKLNNFYKKCKNIYRKKRIIDIRKAGCTANNVSVNNKTKNDVLLKPQTKNEGSIDNEKENDKSYCDACNPNKEPIIISENNDKIKYCHKCSCIFDTDECNYCLRKANSKLKIETLLCFCGVRSCCVTSFKNHSNLHENPVSFNCDLCGFKTDTKQEIKKHLYPVHCKGSNKSWDHCYAQKN